MTTIQMQELLEKLSLLRAVLNGDIDPAVVGLKLKDTDGGNRRAVALAMLDEIGSDVFESLQSDKDNKPPFGFAAGRKKAA